MFGKPGVVAATVVAPGHNMAVPLMPEFIAKQDGAEKQDCSRPSRIHTRHCMTS